MRRFTPINVLPCGAMSVCRVAVLFVMAALGLLPLRSQTTAVSNLGPPRDLAVSSNIGGMNAISFTTGATSYDFFSVTTHFRAYGSEMGGFSFSLYSDSGGNAPSSLLRTLVGTVPTSDTIAEFTYTPATPLTFAAGATFWLVLAAPTTNYGSGYDWTALNSVLEDAGALAGWSIGNSRKTSENGISWLLPAGTIVPQFSLAVTAVPEPGSMVLIF